MKGTWRQPKTSLNNGFCRAGIEKRAGAIQVFL
jgi:hypothetical protein